MNMETHTSAHDTQVTTQITHKPTATLTAAGTFSPGGEGGPDESSLTQKPASASLSPRLSLLNPTVGTEHGVSDTQQ